MLSDYTSILEVISAIYFSMCIDNVLGNIWTPKYKDKVEALVGNIDTPVTDNMKKEIRTHVESFSYGVSKHMRVKSIFMLIVCVFLLLVAGLENHLEWLKVTSNTVELILRLSILVLLVFLIGKISFKKYSAVFVDFFAIICALWILYVHDFSLMSFPFVTENSVIVFLIFVLFLPILWQVFQCWAYYSLYYGYLNEKTFIEKDLLQRALQAYRIKEAAAAPNDYIVSVAEDLELSFSVDGNSEHQDSTTTSVYNKFIERMELACQYPTPMKLVQSDIVHHWNKRFHPERLIMESSAETKKTIFNDKKGLPTIDEHRSVESVIKNAELN